MAMKISDMLIAMTMVSLFISLILIIMTSGSSTYGVGFDNSSPIFSASASALANITASAQETQDKAMEISTDQGLLDIVGAMFSQGYQAIKTSIVSYAQSLVLFGAGLAMLELGPAASIIQTAIVTVIIIIVFIAIFLRIIVKEQV